MLSHSTLFVRGYFKAWLEIELKKHVSKMKEKDLWATVAHFSNTCLLVHVHLTLPVQMGGFQFKVKCNIRILVLHGYTIFPDKISSCRQYSALRSQCSFITLCDPFCDLVSKPYFLPLKCEIINTPPLQCKQTIQLFRLKHAESQKPLKIYLQRGLEELNLTMEYPSYSPSLL